MADCFLLFDEEVKEDVSDKILPFFEETILPCALTLDKIPEFAPESRVYLYISDKQAPAVIEAAIKGDWHIAFLPHPNAPFLQRGFCLDNNIENEIIEAQQAKPRNVDALRCNGEFVLSSVIVGHAFNLSPDSKSPTWLTQLKNSLNNIRHIHHYIPKKLSFVTGREASFDTAAIGLVLFEHSHKAPVLDNVVSDSHINDGMFHAMILAPRSIMTMLGFFITAPFNRIHKQPDFIGLVKTQSLTIKNNKTITYSIDGETKTAPELIMETEQRVLKLLVSTDFPISSSAPSIKEKRQIEHLPSSEAVQEMASKSLPFIAHAATEEFKELYQLLRENAKTTPVFLTLMVLSTLLASIGLFANSTPVIIGAMILAPLMAPIISMSMALTRQDANLLATSIKTLFIGSSTALAFAAIASFIMPMEVITAEIAARLTPNLLDLGIAVISGIAGAYAHARVSAAKSMAGVAIAVALVPPIAVAGIGLGWLNFHVAWGAILLFLTNLIGIVFAASLTFLALGFSPFNRAKKGLAVELIAVLLISIPLVTSFINLSDEAQIVKSLQNQNIGNHVIRSVEAHSVNPLEISIEVITTTALTDTDIDLIKETIENKLSREVIIEVQAIIRR